MTHLLNPSALRAHFLAEPGAERVQALFADAAVGNGTSILSLCEFELRQHQLGVDGANRTTELNRYRALLNEVVVVDEAVRSEAIRLRTRAAVPVAAMDILIVATAALMTAPQVDRPPHFAALPGSMLNQEVLPAKWR